MTKSKKSSSANKVDPPGWDQSPDVEVGLDKGVESSVGRKKSVVLSPSEDPFAPRDGKALLWRNINMTLVSLFY